MFRPTTRQETVRRIVDRYKSEFLSTKQVGEVLGMKKDATLKFIRENNLDYYLHGNKKMYITQDVIKAHERYRNAPMRERGA